MYSLETTLFKTVVTSVVAVALVREPSVPVAVTTAVTGMVKVVIWVENEVKVTGTALLLFKPTVTVTVVGSQYEAVELENIEDISEDEEASREATLSSSLSLSEAAFSDESEAADEAEAEVLVMVVA